MVSSTGKLSVLADVSMVSIYIFTGTVLLFAFVYIPDIFLFGDMYIRARFTAVYEYMCNYSGMYIELCIYVLSSHIERVRINRVRLPIMLVVSYDLIAVVRL